MSNHAALILGGASFIISFVLSYIYEGTKKSKGFNIYNVYIRAITFWLLFVVIFVCMT